MSVATPHGLAVAGALFMLGGLAILGAALLNRALLSSLKTSFDSPAKMGVTGAFALPLVAFGLFLQAAGNMVDVSIGPGLTSLLLALAFGLVVFVLLDEHLAEAFASKAAHPAGESEVSAALPAPVRDAISEVAKAAPSSDAPKIALVS